MKCLVYIVILIFVSQTSLVLLAQCSSDQQKIEQKVSQHNSLQAVDRGAKKSDTKAQHDCCPTAIDLSDSDHCDCELGTTSALSIQSFSAITDYSDSCFSPQGFQKLANKSTRLFKPPITI